MTDRADRKGTQKGSDRPIINQRKFDVDIPNAPEAKSNYVQNVRGDKPVKS